VQSRKQHTETLNLTVFINKFRIINILIYCLINRLTLSLVTRFCVLNPVNDPVTKAVVNNDGGSLVRCYELLLQGTIVHVVSQINSLCPTENISEANRSIYSTKKRRFGKSQPPWSRLVHRHKMRLHFSTLG